MEYVNFRLIPADYRARMSAIDHKAIEDAETAEQKAGFVYVLKRDFSGILDDVPGEDPPVNHKLVRASSRP